MSTSIPIISSPISEPWTAWILLLLLVLAVLANVLQPGVVVNSFATVFTKPERTYSDPQRTALGQVCLHVFQLGTLGMAYYLFCYRTGDFSITRYGIIVGLVTVVYLIKWLVMMLLNYTFQLQKHCATIWIHYGNLLCVFCCLLYPLLLFVQNAGLLRILQVLLLVVTSTFVLLVFIKYCRAYLLKPVALMYILLSVLTLEVLPLLGVYYGTEFILSQSLIQL